MCISGAFPPDCLVHGLGNIGTLIVKGLYAPLTLTTLSVFEDQLILLQYSLRAHRSRQQLVQKWIKISEVCRQPRIGFAPPPSYVTIYHDLSSSASSGS